MIEIYLEINGGLVPFKVEPGKYLEIPATQFHGGSEKLQPDRIYVLGFKRELSDGQKLAPPDGTAQETHHLVSF